MKIEITAPETVYITVGNWVIYIDNSTGEQIVQQWMEH